MQHAFTNFLHDFPNQINISLNVIKLTILNCSNWLSTFD